MYFRKVWFLYDLLLLLDINSSIFVWFVVFERKKKSVLLKILVVNVLMIGKMWEKRIVGYLDVKGYKDRWVWF